MFFPGIDSKEKYSFALHVLSKTAVHCGLKKLHCMQYL